MSKLLLVFQCSGSVQGSMVACAKQENIGVKRNLILLTMKSS